MTDSRPLPPHWIVQFDRNYQRNYYVDTRTGVSQWEFPQTSINTSPQEAPPPYTPSSSTPSTTNAIPAAASIPTTQPTQPIAGLKSGADSKGETATDAEFAQRLRQEQEDEEFARRLQAEEDAAVTSAVSSRYQAPVQQYTPPPPQQNRSFFNRPSFFGSSQTQQSSGRMNTGAALGAGALAGGLGFMALSSLGHHHHHHHHGYDDGYYDDGGWDGGYDGGFDGGFGDGF
ncbi:hypothetical protein SpCBS45565_g06860 [Spizellomyces sp. 'palustris']|nr:hypothetical protein SpCBS45565_g06860 [Spizellomyces sp. 'palustris']